MSSPRLGGGSVDGGSDRRADDPAERVPFPPGRYLSATGTLRPGRGGQTGALLQRSRLLGTVCGGPVDVLTFDPSPGYDAYRAALRSTGQLTGGMRVLNLYEHYRERGWGAEPGSGQPLPPLPGTTRRTVRHADGSPWKTEYLDGPGDVVVNDFQRRDGSTYLRASPYSTTTTERWPAELVRVGGNGEVLGAFTSLGQWYRRWLRELAAGVPTFVVVDSRFLLPHLVPNDDEGVYVIYQLHNCHVQAPRRWDSPSTPDYERILTQIAAVDAFVTLTHRQREDICRVQGERENMVVVPHPVTEVKPPTPLPAREPHRVVMLARLQSQKRLMHALDIVAQARRDVPEIRLDVYGEGTRRAEITTGIAERGLQQAVTLRGHDPAAREQLWSASASLLTSRYEGFGLVVLESLARGCPVISYDIPYGPREQVQSGINGFLVEDGDRSAAARRLVELLTSPALVGELSSRARPSLAAFEVEPYLQRWARVFADVVARAGTRIRELQCESDVEVRRQRDGAGAGQLRITGRLRPRADNPTVDLADAVLRLVAIRPAEGGYVELPVTSQVDGGELTVDASVDPRLLRRAARGSAAPYLELRVSWHNACWRARVPEPTPDPQSSGTVLRRLGAALVRRIPGP